jgi:hypothetical protein
VSGDAMVVVLDFSGVLGYLERALEIVIGEEEVYSSILSLLLDSTLRFEQAWTDPHNPLDEARQYLVSLGFDEQIAVDIMRRADAMIHQIIVQALPDFGAGWYYGQVTYEVKHEHTVLLTVCAPAIKSDHRP